MCDDFKYSSKIHKPQSLNIKNTFDLIEKLTPLLNYIFSNIERFIKEDEEYQPDCYFSITASVEFTHGDICYDTNDYWFTKSVVLFYIFYGIGGLTRDIDIFQKITLKIKEEIETNPYNLIFNTKPFDIKVEHRNRWPYTNAERIEYGRMGNSARFRKT